MGKILILVGLILIIVGVLIVFKIPLPLGNLPGDIVVKAEHGTFYFPITTCIVLSILFSMLYYFFFSRL